MTCELDRIGLYGLNYYLLPGSSQLYTVSGGHELIWTIKGKSLS